MGDTCWCYEPEVFGHTECWRAPPIPEHERVDLVRDDGSPAVTITVGKLPRPPRRRWWGRSR